MGAVRFRGLARHKGGRAARPRLALQQGRALQGGGWEFQKGQGGKGGGRFRMGRAT